MFSASNSRKRTLLRFLSGILTLYIVMALEHDATAQNMLALPYDSQAATVSQRVGLTDIAINYHRPLVKGRKIFGEVVPYGQVWRAGANENTTVSFSDDVTVEGQHLAKGVYGLHTIPTADDWTVIFSKNSTSWGSFTYDDKEDALRIKVKPQASDMHEYLTYDFTDVKPDSALVLLQWDKLAVPFHVAIDANQTVGANVALQLRGALHWQWQAYHEAADYNLKNKGDLQNALAYANRSVELEPHFTNLMTQAQVFDALDKHSEAEAARAKALPIADAIELYVYARGLQRSGHPDQAMDIFHQDAKRFPDHWLGHLALSRFYSNQGKYPEATREMTASMAIAPADQKPTMEGYLNKLKANQDFNK